MAFYSQEVEKKPVDTSYINALLSKYDEKIVWNSHFIGIFSCFCEKVEWDLGNQLAALPKFYFYGLSYITFNIFDSVLYGHGIFWKCNGKVKKKMFYPLDHFRQKV